MSLEGAPGIRSGGRRCGRGRHLRTTLTDELIEEGLFREVLNRIQTFRKELDLEYTGRIRLTLAGSLPILLDAVRPRVSRIWAAKHWRSR